MGSQQLLPSFATISRATKPIGTLSDMQAVILAGGKGTRLKPYTTVIPKPLMPLGELSILEIILRQLKAVGVDDIVLAVGYLAHLFEALIGHGDRFGLRVAYAQESGELGTAGPLANLLDRLDDEFLVMNGDLLTTVRYDRVLEAHKANGAAATICTFQREVKIDFGVVESSGGYLSHYIEKPTFKYQVSMGVNALTRADVAPHLRVGERLDMPDLLNALMAAGKKVQTLPQDCLWLDIGRHEDYAQATDIFESRKAEFLL
jgi:NDP-mannose synthase